jgi:diketogulonate reductase-like aldo/keto reductase
MKNEDPKIEVHKIDIKIGDKVISLKPEQVKELKKILNEMFEESKVVHDYHYVDRYLWHWPYYNPYQHWTTTCDSGTGSYLSSTGNVTLCLNAA